VLDDIDNFCLEQLNQRSLDPTGEPLLSTFGKRPGRIAALSPRMFCSSDRKLSFRRSKTVDFVDEQSDTV